MSGANLNALRISAPFVSILQDICHIFTCIYLTVIIPAFIILAEDQLKFIRISKSCLFRYLFCKIYRCYLLVSSLSSVLTIYGRGYQIKVTKNQWSRMPLQEGVHVHYHRVGSMMSKY